MIKSKNVLFKARFFTKRFIWLGVCLALALSSSYASAQVLQIGKFAYGYYQAGYDYSQLQWKQLTHVIDFAFSLKSIGDGSWTDAHQAD